MRNLKKILALVLALMMVLSVMVTASASFADDADIQYTEAVDVMVAAGILSGYKAEDGTYTFNPKGTLTRAEAAKLIAYAAKGPSAANIAKCETVFDDVAAGHWASGFIAFGYENGYINGKTETTYAPGAQITVQEYAKLLLGVLGIEGEYTGAKWYVAVRNNAIAAKLMTGMTYEWTANVTREQAAQMTFNVVTYKTAAEFTGKYVVAPSDALVEDAENEVAGAADKLALVEEAALAPFDTRADALVYMTALTLELTTDYTIEAQKNPSSYLLLKNFGIAQSTGVDLYGRPAVVYTVGYGTDDAYNMYYNNTKATKTYTGKVDAKTIATDLKGYSMVVGVDTSVKVEATTEYAFSNAAGAIVSVDNNTKATLKVAASLTESCTLSEALSALTADNTTVSFYTNNKKVITSIVVIKEHASTIAAVDVYETATGAEYPYIVLETGDVFFTGAYTEDDIGTIVLYTQDAEGVNAVKTAEVVNGTLTKYTNKGVYTFAGENYAISAAAIEGTQAAVEATVGGKDAYGVALNTAGCIVGVVGAEAPEAPALPTDYVVVVDSEILATVEATEDFDEFLGEEGAYTITISARVKVMHEDGTFAIYNLPVVQASAALAAAKSLTEDSYYVVVNGAYIEILAANKLETVDVYETEIEFAPVYAYAVEEKVISLYELDEIAGDEEEDGIVIGCIDGTVAKNSVAINAWGDYPVLVNADTKIVYNYTEDGETVTKVVTGLSNTNGLPEGYWGMIIAVDVTELEDEFIVRTYTAQTIYVTDKPVPGPSVPVVAYITGEYTASGLTVEVGGVEITLYAYVAYGMDGKETTLLSTSTSLNAGLVQYAAASGLITGTVNVESAEYAYAGTLGIINDSVVTVEGTYLLMSDATVVVGEIENGCEVIVVVDTTEGGNANMITTLYVVAE